MQHCRNRSQYDIKPCKQLMQAVVLESFEIETDRGLCFSKLKVYQTTTLHASQFTVRFKQTEFMRRWFRSNSSKCSSHKRAFYDDYNFNPYSSKNIFL